ncbi:hypothetical protein BGZ46_006105, partial [Entomortierella lignicola]
SKPLKFTEMTGEQLLDHFSKVTLLDKYAEGFETAKTFTNQLKELLNWLELCHKDMHDTAFTSWLISMLKTTQGIMSLKFNAKFSPDVTVLVRGLQCLIKENWLNDDTIWRIYQYINISYQDQDSQQPIMIPYDYLQHWRGHLNEQGITKEYKCDWGKGEFVDGNDIKAFAIIHMSNHWGAVCIDFKERHVYFGDSLDRGFPDDARKAIARWLVFLGLDIKKWKSVVRRFNVPRQKDSGSCGVVACNTVERTINKKVSPWSNENSVCHRLRLMRLMTGYTKT